MRRGASTPPVEMFWQVRRLSSSTQSILTFVNCPMSKVRHLTRTESREMDIYNQQQKMSVSTTSKNKENKTKHNLEIPNETERREQVNRAKSSLSNECMEENRGTKRTISIQERTTRRPKRNANNERNEFHRKFQLGVIFRFTRTLLGTNATNSALLSVQINGIWTISVRRSISIHVPSRLAALRRINQTAG